MMKFICYPKYSTCKKAQAWLDENGIGYEIRDIKTILYREMNLKDKLSDMSEDEQLDLLASDGMLVKRPIAVSDDIVLVGFNSDKWAALK